MKWPETKTKENRSIIKTDFSSSCDSVSFRSNKRDYWVFLIAKGEGF